MVVTRNLPIFLSHIMPLLNITQYYRTGKFDFRELTIFLKAKLRKPPEKNNSERKNKKISI